MPAHEPCACHLLFPCFSPKERCVHCQTVYPGLNMQLCACPAIPRYETMALYLYVYCSLHLVVPPISSLCTHIKTSSRFACCCIYALQAYRQTRVCAFTASYGNLAALPTFLSKVLNVMRTVFELHVPFKVLVSRSFL